MDKRENLRNPDLLPFDYVSVLIEWQSNPSLVFRVVKVLKSSIPFNAEMLSIAGSNGNNTVNFTFQSPFDVLTSPWQFELEASFTAAAGRYRPTAVYNASNNLVVVKFPILTNVVPSGSFVVFTAKRYRPTTQYLAQLAAASASSVTIASAAGAPTEISNIVPTDTTVSSLSTFGIRLTAPSNFVITGIQRYSNPYGVVSDNSMVSWNIKIVKFNAALPTTNASTLFEQYNIPYATNTLNSLNIIINSADTIGVLVNYKDSGNNILYYGNPFSNGPYNVIINGSSVAVNGLQYSSTITTTGGNFSATNSLFAASIKLFYGGTSSWSNIIY